MDTTSMSSRTISFAIEYSLRMIPRFQPSDWKFLGGKTRLPEDASRRALWQVLIMDLDQ